MEKAKRHSVTMAKHGAYLHNKHNQRKASVIPNKKRQASQKACRGKIRG